MNKKKILQSYQEVASAAGLRYDEANNLFRGERGGFDFIVYPTDDNQPFALTLHTAAKSADGSVLDRKTVHPFVKSNKNIRYLGQKNMDIWVSVKLQSNAEKLKNATSECLTAMTIFLRANNYSPCCDLCGQPLETSALKISGEYHHMCPDCEMKIRSDAVLNAQNTAQKKENIIGGIVGALLGSLLGALSILILSQLGYVAAVSGAIMAVCVLKGYEMLGGKLTKKAIVISVIIMILMTYFGDRMAWAIILFRDAGGADAGFNIFECYRLVSYALAEDIIDIGSYVINLFELYLFVALGAVPAIRRKLKEKKEEGVIVCIPKE